MMDNARTKAKLAEAASPATAPKHAAILSIEARGDKASTPREHALRLALDLTSADDKALVRGVAREALAAFAAALPGATFSFSDPTAYGTSKVMVLEADALLPDSPDEGALQLLRATLVAAGYRLSIKESRECSECLATVSITWNGPAAIPPGWYASTICGKHDYRACSGCASIYVMSSSSSNGPAPSLRCEVCDAIMVEWGGTKLWHAERVIPKS